MRYEDSDMSGSDLIFLNWALTAYSQAALALLRSDDGPSLLQGVCDAMVRNPIYCLAWIGIAEPDKSVRIAAQSGMTQAYLDGLSVSWDASVPTGLGPTGVALRTGSIQVLTDSELTPHFEPWRTRAN